MVENEKTPRQNRKPPDQNQEPNKNPLYQTIRSTIVNLTNKAQIIPVGLLIFVLIVFLSLPPEAKHDFVKKLIDILEGVNKYGMLILVICLIMVVIWSIHVKLLRKEIELIRNHSDDRMAEINRLKNELKSTKELTECFKKSLSDLLGFLNQTVYRRLQ